MGGGGTAVSLEATTGKSVNIHERGDSRRHFGLRHTLFSRRNWEITLTVRGRRIQTKKIKACQPMQLIDVPMKAPKGIAILVDVLLKCQKLHQV